MREFKLGSSSRGNGIVIWNSLKEVHGDYERIAHVDYERKVFWTLKNPPVEVVDYVNDIANGPNHSISTSQPHLMAFKD